MVLAIGAVVLFVAHTKFVYGPVSRQVGVYKAQIKKAEKQMSDLRSKRPQEKEVSGTVQELQNESLVLTAEKENLEKQMPSRFQLSQLVGEVTRLAQEVKLESVKQKIVKDQDFSRVYLEVKYYSSYVDSLRYIAAVEALSPFLRVEEMELAEPKGKSVELGGAPVRVLFSCLLSDSPTGADLTSDPETGNRREEIRDVMASNARPVARLEESKFVLEGITFDPRNPTAIINGDVYQVNSEISGFKVKQILSDSVILSDGVQDHMLSLKAVSEARS